MRSLQSAWSLQNITVSVLRWCALHHVCEGVHSVFTVHVCSLQMSLILSPNEALSI